MISPALQLASGSNAVVTLSYHGQGIADGHTASDIDMFLEDADLDSSYLDISQSRNTTTETVSGNTTSFGKFILGLAVHDPAQENALRKQAFLGSDINMLLRDIDFSENVNATISLDKSSYRLTETATLTIEDKNADLDPTEIDSISAFVVSESSDPSGITVPLTETADNSGIFRGTFTFESSGNSSGTTLEASVGDELSVSYNQTNGARFKATLHEVAESGVVDVYDLEIDPDSTPFSALGYTVAIKLIDTQLSTSDDEITLILSYANADLDGSDENYIRIFQGIDLGGGVIDWIHLPISEVDSDTDFTLGLDTENKTVTADAEFFESAGIFVLGFEEGSPGGEGGGLGSTEPQEILAEGIASIRSSSSGGGGGGGGGGGAASAVAASGPEPVGSTPGGAGGASTAPASDITASSAPPASGRGIQGMTAVDPIFRSPGGATIPASSLRRGGSAPRAPPSLSSRPALDSVQAESVIASSKNENAMLFTEPLTYLEDTAHRAALQPIFSLRCESRHAAAAERRRRRRAATAISARQMKAAPSETPIPADTHGST